VSVRECVSESVCERVCVRESERVYTEKSV